MTIYLQQLHIYGTNNKNEQNIYENMYKNIYKYV